VRRLRSSWLRWGGIILLTGVWLIAGSGCREHSTGSTIDPMLLEVWDGDSETLKTARDAAAAQARKEAVAAKKKADAEKELARLKKKQLEDEKRKNEPPPLQVDSNKVHQMQMAALQDQQEYDQAVIQKDNSFTHWLDGFHQMWYCRLDNAVRLVDTKWLREDGEPYNYELSTFYIRALARVGGRSNDNEYDFKLRVSGDIALPGLEDKLHLVLNNVARDALPGEDPLEQKSQASIGVKTAWRSVRNSELSLGSGLRWRSSAPVLYLELDWRWQKDFLGGRFSLDPRGFWFSDDGLGQTISMTWTRQTYEKQYFQIRTAERSTEQTDGLECEQTFRYVWLRSGTGRGWLAQASFFPQFKSSTWIWDDTMVNLSWRDALYRKWIYYSITPQIDFPKEDGYEPRPSLRIGIEVLFGGKIDNLI